MNTKIRMLMALVAVVTLCLVSLEPLALAQSPKRFMGPRGSSAPSPNSNCKQLKGTEVNLYDPNADLNNGTVTNGGFLNGPTLWTYPPTGFVITPDQDVVAFLSDVTITTVDGQLKTRVLITFSLVTGLGSSWGSIDPNSTGKFAGATGTIFFDGYTPPPDVWVGPYTSSIAGQICFAQ